MHELVAPLALSAILVAATCVIQIAGLAVLIWIMRARVHRIAPLRRFLHQSGLILVVVLGLFAIHAVQIWIYAFVYLALGEFETVEAALYFSTSSFTTVGYGEIFIETRWRVLAAIESANGFLVLGWSTVFLISVISRLRSVEIDWLEARSEPDLWRDASNRNEDRG